MNIKTIKVAQETYATNLKVKHKYYGLSVEKLGTALQFINSFVRYLEWIDQNGLDLEQFESTK